MTKSSFFFISSAGARTRRRSGAAIAARTQGRRAMAAARPERAAAARPEMSAPPERAAATSERAGTPEREAELERAMALWCRLWLRPPALWRGRPSASVSRHVGTGPKGESSNASSSPFLRNCLERDPSLRSEASRLQLKCSCFTPPFPRKTGGAQLATHNYNCIRYFFTDCVTTANFNYFQFRDEWPCLGRGNVIESKLRARNFLNPDLSFNLRGKFNFANPKSSNRI